MALGSPFRCGGMNVVPSCKRIEVSSLFLQAVACHSLGSLQDDAPITSLATANVCDTC